MMQGEKIQRAVWSEDESNGVAVFRVDGGDRIETKGIVKIRQRRF
jgi:hypothetical protein